MEACYHSHTLIKSEVYCNWTMDSVLCWPATKANSTVEQPCPKMKGSDTTKTLKKRCEENGKWETNENTAKWTNFTECFTPEIIELLNRADNVSVEELKMKIEIAKMVRKLEIVGLVISLIVLCLSIIIYYVFGTLKNDRTRIHKHLFNSELGAVVLKLVICVDQIIYGYDNIIPTYTGVDGTPFLCEVVYILLEYCKSSTYMWMFIEALHLHNAVAVTATQMSFKRHYLLIGWLLSAMFVVIWVTVMISKPRSHCWWGYIYNPSYWILEGPRIMILTANTIFLTSIIKVIFVKLRSNPACKNEMEIIKKTLKSTLILLPLLGITNCLSHIEPKLDCPLWYFGIYSFVTYFLNSFQGMFIGLIYCLLNQEVKEIIKNKIWTRYSFGKSDTQQTQNQKNDSNVEMMEAAECIGIKF